MPLYLVYFHKILISKFMFLYRQVVQKQGDLRKCSILIAVTRMRRVSLTCAPTRKSLLFLDLMLWDKFWKIIRKIPCYGKKMIFQICCNWFIVDILLLFASSCWQFSIENFAWIFSHFSFFHSAFASSWFWWPWFTTSLSGSFLFPVAPVPVSF